MKISRRIINFLLPYFLVGLHSLLVVFIMEWIFRGNLGDTFIWTKGFTKPFFYNFLLVFLLFGGLMIFRRKIFVLLTQVSTILFLFLSVGSRIKQDIRGEPILPADLILGSEAKNMISFFSHSLIYKLLVALIVIVLILGYVIYRIPNQKKRNYYQVVLSSLLLCSFFFITFFGEARVTSYLKGKLGINYYAFNQRVTYNDSGLLASFLNNLQWLEIDKPKAYNENTIRKIVDSTPNREITQNELPDVIMIMSEAFWDPTTMANVEFSVDPLKNFHDLSNKYTSGNLVVPVFGGNTVNTEFEVLTSMSTQFLPVGSIPYYNYLNKPLLSLPLSFRENGYDTTAIHSYHHWFYQRSNVYKNLGFDEFISIEYFEKPLLKGYYYKDQSITDEILWKLRKNDNPKFIFAVTTQNHGPYMLSDEENQESLDVNLKGDKEFTEEAKNTLKAYSLNQIEIDSEIKRLIEEVEKTNRKTIIVYFGDHLPLLGDNNLVYKEAGYLNGADDFNEYNRMYTTPLLIWDNFTNNKEELDINASMLGPALLERAGIQGNFLTNYYLGEIKEGDLSKIVRLDYLSKLDNDEKTIEEIKLLQYDILFGKRYGLKPEKEIPVSDDYRIGYGDPIINNVQMDEKGNQKVLVIKGEFFTGYTRVYINGEFVDKLSNTRTEIIVPYIEGHNQFEVQLKIMDSNNKVLSKSNLYSYNS